MIYLYAHQRDLIKRLRDPSCPRAGVVLAPPGAGIRTAVALHVADVARSSLAMVVTATVAEALQWAARLHDRDVPSRLLTGASDALGLLENDDRPQDGAIVTTYSRLRSGPSRRALAGVRPSLLVWDEVTAVPPAELADQARQVVTLATPADRQRWATWPVLLSVGMHGLPAGRRPALEVPVEVSHDERELRAKARALLGQLGAEPSGPWSAGLPSLHARLLAAATNAGEPLATQVWELLERIENAPPDDDRQNTLRRLLAAAPRPCLFVAPTPAEAVYTADQLAVPVIDATMSRASRRRALTELAPGRCAVSTPVVDDLWHDLPADSVVVLLPFPEGSTLPDRVVDAVGDRPGLDVVLLKEVTLPDGLEHSAV